MEPSVSDTNDKNEKPTESGRTSNGESATSDPAGQPGRPKEIGGPAGPEPTRYGDWERNGRCSDF